MSKTRQKILAAILLEPEKAWYASELARNIGAPVSSLQRELGDLCAADILIKSNHGRMVYYKANQELSIFAELQSLLIKTVGLVDQIASALESLRPRLRIAFIYGSVATGTEHGASDVDIFIIGEQNKRDVAVALRSVSEKLDREINAISYTQAEFIKKRRNNDHFVTNVVKGDKIFVLGKMDELDRITG